MVYPDDKVAEVCRLGPVKAKELLDRGRAGDHQALADWAVLSAYRYLIKLGASPAEALHHARVIMQEVDLKVSIAHG